jgi:hypothetical protein
MALPEFIAPVVAVVGTPALAYIAARYSGHVVRALVMLVVSMVAIKTGNEDRRKACLDVLDKVTRLGGPPAGQRRTPAGRRLPVPLGPTLRSVLWHR